MKLILAFRKYEERLIKGRYSNRNLYIASNIIDMIEYRKINPNISFVPTMGALHEGHLYLVKRAKAMNNKVVVSIFVNPKQFSIGEDLDKYPRQLESDLSKLKPLGVDCVFTPTKEDMYPEENLCYVEPSQFNLISEGKARPDFFRGVATVVCKLFNIIQPKYAFFGQKDISQCILIKRMVNDLNIPTKIIICPTIRENNGLAMSSRNLYLSPTELKVASILFKALSLGKSLCEDNSVERISREDIISIIEKELLLEPLVHKIEYISIASHINMIEMNEVTDSCVISTAIRLGSVRLIDNVLVGNAVKDILN